jgi:hypothetical protein
MLSFLRQSLLPPDYSELPKSSSITRLMGHRYGLDGTITHPKMKMSDIFVFTQHILGSGKFRITPIGLGPSRGLMAERVQHRSWCFIYYTIC